MRVRLPPIAASTNNEASVYAYKDNNFARGVTVVGSLFLAYANREENVNELLDHKRLAKLQVLPVRAL
jgi:hypothetical protein